ncbi:uncharacterized protein [Aegilops tauschii subsp. strangulata]|nr:uncharacterized protein LOC109768582 [Aegilops tauschii subsp. strangulata]XP_044354716.1 uncharacterized protein LOC123076634 [Triticum aestivum]
MLGDKPVQISQLANDGDGANKAWTGEKRRRKNLPPSSSHATATADDHGDMEDTIQGGKDPISHATDMEGTIQGGQDQISHATDMEGTIQAGQDYDLLLKTEPAQEESEQRFGPHFLLSKEDQAKDRQLLLANIQKEDDYPTDLPLYLTREEHRKIEARLARYRVAHYKVVNPECARELKEPEEYTDDEILNESYFEGLEDDESFEWYIHREDTYNIELNDYQRIVPRNFLPGRSGNLYCYHDEYRSRYHTYKIDDVYVKYYAEISKKIKWIADFLHLDRRTKDWIEWDTRAWRQALRIATGFPHMTEKLAGYAYDEYITELEMDASLKDIDLLYFEIWRLVAKENRTYKEAVKEVYESGEFPIHKAVLHAELNGGHIFVTMQEMIYAVVLEGGIELTDEEKKARGVFRKLSFSMHKPMNMAQYAQKKVEIANQLKLNKEDGFVPFRPFEF